MQGREQAVVTPYAVTPYALSFLPIGARSLLVGSSSKDKLTMRLVSHKQATRRLTIGDCVNDQLVIRSVLGQGATAIVFEALHTRLEALVALKVMDVAPEYARAAAARLGREAQVCAAVDDPRIPKIYDFGRLNDGTPYIVMEKVSGRTLSDLLAEGPLAVPVALGIVRELMHALSAVHRVGVVHRDVKPANVILQTAEDGFYRVHLMDFGVSKAVSRGTSNPAITLEGALVGTPHYMAPEQISDEGLDERTDVYATGVLLYELLAGRVPFGGQSTVEVMTAVMRHTPEPLSKWCREVSPGVARLVARAMSPRPADRFASANEMREAIEAEISALGAPLQSLIPSRPVAIASLSSLALAGFIAFAARQNTQLGDASVKGPREDSEPPQHEPPKGPEGTTGPAPNARPNEPITLTPALIIETNAAPREGRVRRPSARRIRKPPAKSPHAASIEVPQDAIPPGGVAASLNEPDPLPRNPY